MICADYAKHTNLGGWKDLHDGFVAVDLTDNDSDLDSRYSTTLFTVRVKSVIANHSATLANMYRSVKSSNSANQIYPGLFVYVAWNAGLFLFFSFVLLFSSLDECPPHTHTHTHSLPPPPCKCTPH